MLSKAKRFFQRLRQFGADQRGNVAIIFGATLLPVAGLTGAAIDYSMGYNIRYRLQAAADAAALAATRNYGKDWATRQQIATNTFNANLSELGLTQPVNFTIEDMGQNHHVEASTTVETTFMGLMGVESMETHVEADAVSPSASVEVALVLDNTGSMSSQNKLSILKTASKNFLDMMEEASNIPGKTIKVGLVPFTTMVRLEPTTYKNASWIKMTPGKNKNKWKGCLYDRHMPYDTNDTTPISTDDETKFDPDPDNGFSKKKCKLAKIHELSSDFTSLRSRIDSMTANGWTNITLGTAWGLHLLSPETPMSEGDPWSEVETVKIMILLTDGENTRSRWSNDTSTIDERTEMACDSVKAKDILVYTVRVVNGNQTLLKNCATDDWMYTNIQQASDLNATFEQLAADIINRHLRLTM